MGIQLHALGPGEVLSVIQVTGHKDGIVLNAEFFNALVQADISLKETNTVLLGIDALYFTVRNLDSLVQKLRIRVLGIHVRNDIIRLHKTGICLHADNLAVII